MVFSLKEQIDYYVEFKDWYQKIIENFKFNIEMDREARDILSQILQRKRANWDLESVLNSFKNLIHRKNSILIYGCGPSLENTIERIIKKRDNKFLNHFINLAADGAAILLRERGIKIHGIFTDLDGISKDDFNHAEFVVVHAHGDNISRIKVFKEKIEHFRNIIGTTQVEPLKNIINSGGFTDGDRILFFLRSLLQPNHKLFLIGMDFGNIIGKYSKPDMIKDKEGNDIKIKKLKYAIKLIEWLQREMRNKIYFINSKVVSKEFNNISIEEFEDLIQE